MDLKNAGGTYAAGEGIVSRVACVKSCRWESKNDKHATGNIVEYLKPPPTSVLALNITKRIACLYLRPFWRISIALKPGFVHAL